MKENNIKDYLSIKPSVLFKVHLIQNKVNIQLKKISHMKKYTYHVHVYCIGIGQSNYINLSNTNSQL